MPIDEMAQDLQRLVDRFGQGALRQVTTRAVGRAGAEAEGKMVELAPVDTGNLEASSSVRTERRRGGRLLRSVIRFGAPYAATVHELPDEARGPRTRAKPGNEFGQAGPKYVERVLRGQARTFAPFIGAELQRFWARQQSQRGR